MSMHIAFFEIEPWEQEFFTTTLTGHTLSFSPKPLVLEELSPEIEILSPFIYSHITKDVIDHLPKLRCIATRSTGIDHIDIEYCKNKNITVKNVPSYGVDTIAEHTFALLLAVTRHIIPSVNRTRKAEFSPENLRGLQIAGKTMGIVGFGAIGMRVIELARAFRMKVIVYTRHPDPVIAEKLGCTFVDLSTLLTAADVVSLHLPATTETHHLINKTNIVTMKKGSILINTARGAVVETEAILWALEQKILAGVGLDVLEEERALKEERQLLTKEFLTTGDVKIQLLNHVLLQRDDVIITPHNAFNSTEALQEILAITVHNIQSV